MYVCSLSLECQEDVFSVNTIKGHYKQRVVYIFKYLDGKIDINSKQKKWQSIFDIKGYEVEKNFFYNGKNSSKSIYKYDTNYKLIEIKFTGSSEQYIFYFKYDENRNLIQKDEYNQNNYFYGKETYKYELDEDRNKIETSVYYNQMDEKRSINTCKYNDKGDCIEIKGYSSDFDSRMDWFSFYKYKYDKHGNKISKECYEKDSTISMTSKYKHDKFKNIIEQIDYNKLNEPETKYNYIYSK
jgi:hypothetical protein